jgi:hypothetical protein
MESSLHEKLIMGGSPSSQDSVWSIIDEGERTITPNSFSPIAALSPYTIPVKASEDEFAELADFVPLIEQGTSPSSWFFNVVELEM